jgi:hypothetical protein
MVKANSLSHHVPDAVPGVSHVVNFVNGSDSRYRSLCVALLQTLGMTKMHREDIQAVLADVSDVLDGIQPSPQSGIKLVGKPPRS